ncbi:hypothetical protein HDE_09435 [Halotydeus destructor]|nr:hypothetical protein HDE_09435 [Halotydeus destructor]
MQEEGISREAESKLLCGAISTRISYTELDVELNSRPRTISSARESADVIKATFFKSSHYGSRVNFLQNNLFVDLEKDETPTPCLIYIGQPMTMHSRLTLRPGFPLVNTLHGFVFGVTTCNLEIIDRIPEHIEERCSATSFCHGRSGVYVVQHSSVMQALVSDMTFTRVASGDIEVSPPNKLNPVLDLTGLRERTELIPFVILNGSVGSMKIVRFENNLEPADRKTLAVACNMKPEVTFDDAPMCHVCLECPIDACLLPCSHVKLCMECATEIAHTSSLCPICRAVIKEVRKVYI